MKKISLSSSRRGAALIIVLAFVTLLSVLVIGFFARALLDQQISTSSSNRSKVDLFADGAIDCLSGDLKQEIVDGSAGATPANATYTVYTPNAAGNMVPSLALNGSLTPANVPNLLKMSASGVPFYPKSGPGTATYGNAGPTRASGALSTTPSLNNRSLSLADWNKALLLPLNNTASTTDFTPASLTTANAPSWILVAKDGTNPTGWNANLEDVATNKTLSSPSSPVVGRFAYTMYDEGGLLDANVAGNPPVGRALFNSHSTYAAYKGFLSYADLSQLGLTVNDITALVGWRNYASTQASGIFPSYTLTAQSSYAPTPFDLTLMGTLNGFLHPINTALYKGQTDRPITSRQQFIQLMTAIGNKNGDLSNVLTSLQYLGTFSRGLNQPSYIRPAGIPATPVSTTLKGTAGTGSNSAGGQDATFNPSFLSVVTTTAFTRNDGSTANVGDPLVKKRFNLNRLAWLTYKGPICDGHDGSAATQASDLNSDADIQILANQLHNYYGLSWTFLQQGTKQNIYNTFGLSWVTDNRVNAAGDLHGDNQSKWLYNHTQGNSAGPYAALPAGGAGILPLSGVSSLAAAQAREPDFVELLKAAITAGSKAKAATLATGNKTADGFFDNPSNGTIITGNMPDNIQNQKDVSLNFALIQIVANIIDQYDLDGYPTRILYNDNSGIPTQEFYGVENLPYFYRARSACLEQVPIGKGTIEGPCGPYVDSDTATNLNNASPPASPSTDPLAGQTGQGIIKGSPGVFSFLQIPEIWNPHDQNSPRCAIDPSKGSLLVDHTGTIMCPVNFRLVADSIIPDNTITDQTNLLEIGNLYYEAGATCNDSIVNNYDSYFNTVDGSSSPYKGISTSDLAGGMSPWPNSTAGLVQMQTSITKPFPICPANSALTFTIPDPAANANSNGFFREPTLLMQSNVPSGSNLSAAGTGYGTNSPLYFAAAQAFPGGAVATSFPAILDLVGNGLSSGAQTSAQPGKLGLLGSDGNYYLGIYIGTSPGAWYARIQAGNPYNGASSTPGLPVDANYKAGKPINAGAGNSSNPASPNYYYKYAVVVNAWDSRLYKGFNTTGGGTAQKNFSTGDSFVLTYRMQYQNSYDASNAGGWSTYDTKYGFSGSRGSLAANSPTLAASTPSMYLLDTAQYSVATDPRTSRFSLLHSTDVNPPGYAKGSNYNNAFGWLDAADTVLTSARPDASSGFWVSARDGSGNDVADGMPETYGWVTSGVGTTAAVAPMGLTAQNDPHFNPNGAAATTKIPGASTIPTSSNGAGGTTPQYYADPDGVVRRGMAAYMNGVVGQPLAVANTSASGVETANGTQTQSRPIVLNRPFRSVGELGYVFSGTPWKNLDFFTPESGDSALLDVFSVGDTSDPSGLVAGKVNLNTRQVPVLQAILAGAYQDEQKYYSNAPGGALQVLSPIASPTQDAQNVAKALVARTDPANTKAGQGPLQNVSELVGKYVKSVQLTDPNNGANVVIDGSNSYSGFSGDLINNNINSLSNITFSSTSAANIQRFREASVRALSAVGQTRVWNVMIDLVAQTGRYPVAATGVDNFVVDGQQHLWVHLAIDRLTGQVLDKQVEIVK